MEFRTDLSPIKLRATDQSQQTSKKEPPYLTGKTDDQKARINNLVHNSSLSEHVAGIIDRGEMSIKADLEVITTRNKIAGLRTVKPTNQAFNELKIKDIKQNFTINITEKGDFVIGRDSGSSAGHLNSLGIFLHESHEDSINLVGGNIRFSEGLSDKDIKLINQFLEKNKDIYLLTDSQFNKLQQIVNSNRILNETATDSQKDVKQQSTGGGKTEIKTTEQLTPPNEVHLGQVADKVEKKVSASSMFKIEVMKENKAREKEYKEEAFEKNKAVERQAYLKNETSVDERVAKRNKSE